MTSSPELDAHRIEARALAGGNAKVLDGTLWWRYVSDAEAYARAINESDGNIDSVRVETWARIVER